MYIISHSPTQYTKVFENLTIDWPNLIHVTPSYKYSCFVQSNILILLLIIYIISTCILHLVQPPLDVLVVVSGNFTTLFLDVAYQQRDVRFTVFWCNKEDFRVIINHKICINIIFLIWIDIQWTIYETCLVFLN